MIKKVNNKKNFFENNAGLWGFVGILVAVILSLAGWLFFTDSKKGKIDKLYPNIIFDYEGVSKEKMKEDFGTPFSEYEEEDEDNKLIKKYYYNLSNGSILFDSIGGISRIDLNNYKTNIYIPTFYKRGEYYKDIILGKSTFKDLCENYEIDKIESSRGSLDSAKFTEVEYYSGNFGQYRTFKFGTYNTNGMDGIILNKENSTINERKKRCEIFYDYKIDYIEIY
ncbi:hypothetical protein HGA92_03645 [Candidatus Gracilibacteria bacterium]|nr:hypothetical protein [Candidatus Gracilibacteria bacterium]NUJ99192.1 hypothetical protein [Candidatus Gracilibacteria bacterium]